MRRSPLIHKLYKRMLLRMGIEAIEDYKKHPERYKHAKEYIKSLIWGDER